MRFIALLLVIVFMSACAASFTPTPPAPLRYLALGDSYTIGEGVEAIQTWPAQLVQAMALQGSLLEYEIVARTGWTTDELIAALEERAPQGAYDLVTLLVGVNDQYRGYALEVYRQSFRIMLQKAVVLAGGRPQRVIVVSIPDWGVSPYGAASGRAGIGQEIDAFNQVNREEAQAAGARYVDITPRSRESAGEPFSFVADGLHPSAEQYSAWVELILPEALEAIQGK